MINRLVEPTSGTIEINGSDAMSQSPQELRRGIGYVIQQVGLFPHRTIASNIATVPQDARLGQGPHGSRVDELTTLVGSRPRTARPLPRRTVGWPATARRCGASARRGPAGAADGRAVRRRRPDRAQEPAGRTPRPAGQGPQDDRARDPRRRRGAASRRPDRPDERRRCHRAARDARRVDALTGQRLRGDVSSARTAGCDAWH